MQTDKADFRAAFPAPTFRLHQPKGANMKKPTKKWNPVFRTESIFTPCPPDYDYKILKEIIAKSKIPAPGGRPRNIRFIDIDDPEALAERLNEVNRTHHDFKHWNEAPTLATVRDELKGFLELSEKYHEALSSLGFTAKTHLGLIPEFFDSLQYNVLGLQIEAGKAIQSIKTKPGTRKKSRSTTIIKLSVIYEEFTGRNPAVINGDDPVV